MFSRKKESGEVPAIYESLPEKIGQLAEAVSSALNLEAVLETAMQIARDLTDARVCRVYLIDERGLALHLKASQGSTPEQDEQFATLPLTESFVGQAFASGQLLVVGQDDEIECAFGEDQAFQTLACVPLLSRGQRHGVMVLGFDQDRSFDPDEKVLLTAIGHQVSIAVENVRLFEQQEHQCQIAQTLGQVAAVISSSLDLEEVLERVLGELSRFIAYDSAAIMLIERGIARTAAERGFNKLEETPPRQVPLADMPIGREVIHQRRPVIVADTHRDPLILQMPGLEHVRCVICVPLISHGKVTGLLYLDSVTPNRYTAQDVETAGRFAQHAAIAIENARLHGDLEDKVRRRTQEIRRQRDRTEAILQSVADGVVVTDQEGAIVLANPSAQAWLYFEGKEGQGVNHPLISFIHHQATRPQPCKPETIVFPAWQQALKEPCWRVTNCLQIDCPAHGRNAHCWQVEGAFCHLSAIRFASEEWFQLPECPVRERLEMVSLQAHTAEWREGQEVQGCVIALRDVSRQRKLEQLQSQFVSTVSHELRTPLTNIKLYHNLLKRSATKEKHGHYMEVMEREIGRLERLIQDILDLSRLERQETPSHREAVDLNALVREQVEIQAIQAQNKGLTLHLETLPGDLPIFCDRNQMIQVITNLLSNALNYTPEGGDIWVTTGTWRLQGGEWQKVGPVPLPEPSAPQPPGGGWGVVSVRDTGVGIPHKDQPYVFDRFYRGVQANLGTPGTGLGLAIVREILDIHRGDVLLESAPDEGSTFTVLLPLPEKKGAPSVLVADDEEQIGSLIRRFLTREEIQARWVPDGQQALEAIAADRPDLLILDLAMPVLDGYQVMEELRARGVMPSLPVLVLSSWTEDKFQRVKELGAAEFLNKPFSGAVLVDVVKRLIDRFGNLA